MNKERSRAKSVEEGNKHCIECKKDGRTREGCFKLIGYPESWPGKKGENNKGKAACVKTETGPIPELTYEDYQLFLKHFYGTCNSKGTKLVANMAHKKDEEGKGDYILPGGTKVNGVLYVLDFKCNLLSSNTPPDSYSAASYFGGVTILP
nr:hypothetical protein [Tanacetum cinerariifolium]